MTFLSSTCVLLTNLAQSALSQSSIIDNLIQEKLLYGQLTSFIEESALFIQTILSHNNYRIIVRFRVSITRTFITRTIFLVPRENLRLYFASLFLKLSMTQTIADSSWRSSYENSTV